MTANRAARAKGWREERYRALIQRLIVQRKALGISQVELATKLNRQQPFVSRFETGERRLDAAEFADVAIALDLSPSALIEELWER